MDKQFKLRGIKSFALRQGRMTTRQQLAIENYWPLYGIERADEKLDFAKVFNRVAPVVLEIGFGMGDSLSAMALAQPQHNFLGVEVHRPGVGALLDRCHELNLHNVRMINGDVKVVLECQIPDDSLAGIYILFPDPWPKQRHHKRRLVQVEFIRSLLPKLQANGFIHCATDWEHYAQQMLQVMQSVPELENVSATDFYTEHQRTLTKFENRGKRLGHSIWDLKFRKR